MTLADGTGAHIALRGLVAAVLVAITKLIETRGSERAAALAHYQQKKRELDEFVERVISVDRVN